MSFAPLSPRWIGLDVRSLALFRVAVSNALFWDQLNSFLGERPADFSETERTAPTNGGATRT